ncbi:hypothetical protein SAMN02799630_01720 [Paenibacillus sp. UNCCL117]|uniref:DUF6138 family protein n=1 Tax=unclassified Paenibacillus TaxID=185978 RepID=UPI00087FE68D|nr:MULTISPECIES: DUF6138 family protein [unclassified Paenibacillus]SDC91866.1 hypothetical protein SAMN04488602_104206 [Paenibacillus sp. cl123]SFW29188.1 hypothetical protein SAMN02799630_01720 [Paenibacillus sp. UNCCL117]
MEHEWDWEIVVEDIAAAVLQWAEQTAAAKDAEAIVRRTSLQAGVYDFIRFEYRQGSINVFSTDDDFTSPEVYYRGVPQSNRLTEELLERELLPRLRTKLGRRLASLQQSPLLDFEFTVAGTFWTSDGAARRVRVLHAVEPAKKQRLLEHMEAYIRQELQAGKSPTDELDTFFLARHLVNTELCPQLDAERIKRICDLVMELNKPNKEKLVHHRRYLIQALKHWVEHSFLPAYYEIEAKEWYRKEYQLKQREEQQPDENAVELLLYTAVLILKYEPAYSRGTALGYLDRAKELGSAKAARILKEGSGSLKAEEVSFHSEKVICQAHDVFSTITIKIVQESPASYAKALDFILRLLNGGFPRSFQIKLRSASKHYLPIKGLARSQTHSFFANALQYPSLYPKLAAYARVAMAEYEWYDDGAGDKSCMPGSYAVFGLGLADRAYFPLVRQYMAMVDQEHQSVQDHFTSAWLKTYGIEPGTIPTLTACLLSCTDAFRLKERAVLEADEHLPALVRSLRRKEPFEAGHLIDIVWGGRDKLEAKARKEKRKPKQSQLLALLKLAKHPESHTCREEFA